MNSNKLPPKPTKQVLCEARRIIADKKTWCSGALAKSKTGRAVSPRNAEAETYCALGALQKVQHGHTFNPEARRLVERVITKEYAASPYGGSNIPFVNDLKGQEAIVEMFDRAIQVLNQKEKGVQA